MEQIEPKIENNGEGVIKQIREDLEAIEQSLGRAISGQEPIRDGGIEKLQRAADILKDTRSFLEVL